MMFCIINRKLLCVRGYIDFKDNEYWEVDIFVIFIMILAFDVGDFSFFFFI